MTHRPVAADVYRDQVLRQVPRALGMLDRDAFSRTSGCMDRTHWAWKFTDFPGARFQEGLCVLGFLYATPLEGAHYFRNPRLLRWIDAGFRFWMQIQRRGGDFDEAYPFEHSLAATAFTSFYLAEAWKLVGEDLPRATSERFVAALDRAGRWLLANDEAHGFLSNHLAAAAAALYHAYQITGREELERRSRHFLEKILEHQSPEGWYDEYGGADPGYQTHGSFYLARYHELSGDRDLAASLDRSFEFLAHFVHPDRSIGGEYASRNTQTYYPAAFEMMAGRSGAAAWIAREMLPSIEPATAAGLASVDVYNFFPLLNNYVFAFRAAAQEGRVLAPPSGPSDEPGNVHFPGAGLLKVRRPRFDLFVGLAKCGVVKLFDRERRRLVFSSCGYVGRLESGGIVSNQWQTADREIEQSEGHVVVAGRFYQVSRPVMGPWRFLAFRSFNLTLGRLAAAAAWIKKLLVRVLIYRKREIDLSISRRIEVFEDGIDLVDRIQGSAGEVLETLVHGDAFTTIHMGSSRYFVPHELVAADAPAAFGDPLDVGRLRAGVVREARVRLE